MYTRKTAGKIQEFIIKKKDYGELILYDILFHDFFLFTLASDGKVLLANWETAGNEQVGLNEESLKDINAFIKNTGL